MEKLLLRVEEAADLLGISRSKTYQLIAAGVLPVVRLGSSRRIPVKGLQALIAKQLKQAAR